MRIRIEVKIQMLQGLKIELLRAVDVHKWRPVGSKWSPLGTLDQWSHIPITLIRSRICIRFKVKNLDPDPDPH